MINNWCNENTHGKIPKILNLGDVDASTRLVLTNAIYFKGRWKTQFNKNLTKDEDFYITPDRKIKVPMMTPGGGFKEYPKFEYTETNELQAIELPYEGDEISMLIILPKKDLKEIEKTLTYEKIKKIKENLISVPVELYLPRFKLETTYQLGDVF